MISVVSELLAWKKNLITLSKRYCKRPLGTVLSTPLVIACHDLRQGWMYIQAAFEQSLEGKSRNKLCCLLEWESFEVVSEIKLIQFKVEPLD